MEILRKLALAFPETSEEPHFEKTSFRVGKKIFASVDAKTQLACVKLALTDQDLFSLGENPAVFPVPNKWGKQGWTYIDLNRVHPDLLQDAIKASYHAVAPKKRQLPNEHASAAMLPLDFRNHLTKFTDIDPETMALIAPFFTLQKVKKKENLLLEGQICKSHYFVLKGCLRKFFINDKGVEHTTEFAIENWWMTDNMAFEKALPTEFYIQAVENAEILVISSQEQERLLLEHPVMERYFRFIYQRAYSASQMRIKYLYDFSKEEFYHQLCSKHPEFVQRIPQYLVASFLGFSPEYLSEIRNKRRS